MYCNTTSQYNKTKKQMYNNRTIISPCLFNVSSPTLNYKLKNNGYSDYIVIKTYISNHSANDAFMDK